MGFDFEVKYSYISQLKVTKCMKLQKVIHYIYCWENILMLGFIVTD